MEKSFRFMNNKVEQKMKLKMLLNRKIISYQDYFWWLILGTGIILVIGTGIYTVENLLENIKTLVSQKEEISGIFQAILAIIKIFTIDLLLYYVFMMLATKIIQYSYLKISRKKKMKVKTKLPQK